MKISKQSILISLTMVLMLAFTLLTGCTATQGDAKLTDDTVRKATGKVNAFWDEELAYEDYTTAEKALWEIVGYTEAVMLGDAKNPPENDMYWKQLKPEQQAALTKMGYTESLWNDGDPE